MASRIVEEIETRFSVTDYDEAVFQRNELAQFFAYEHLPPHLQAASRPFRDLAKKIASQLPVNPQRDVALQRLLEAKDAAVRAVVYKWDHIEVPLGG